MRRDAFEGLVRDALDRLPAWLQPALDDVAVVVEDVASDDPDLYGEYLGVPYGLDSTGALPALIHIYERPLVRDFGGDAEALRRQVEITLVHELGHHLGMEEERLDELGYG